MGRASDISNRKTRNFANYQYRTAIIDSAPPTTQSAYNTGLSKLENIPQSERIMTRNQFFNITFNKEISAMPINALI